MPAPISKDPLIREGRDATIDALLRGGPPAKCPYGRDSKRALFWKHGAQMAATAIEGLMRIGAAHA